MLHRVRVKVQGSWSNDGIAYRTAEHADKSAADLMSRWMLVSAYSVEEISEEQAELEHLTIREEPTIKGAGHRVQL